MYGGWAGTMYGAGAGMMYGVRAKKGLESDLTAWLWSRRVRAGMMYGTRAKKAGFKKRVLEMRHKPLKGLGRNDVRQQGQKPWGLVGPE